MGFDAARRSGSCGRAPIRACRAGSDDDELEDDDDELEEDDDELEGDEDD
jgi:hypothetical protein